MNLSSDLPLQQLVPTAFLTNAAVAVYSSPFSSGMNGITIITGFVFANTTGAAVAVTLYNVAPGGTATASNMIIPGSAVGANGAWFLSNFDGMFIVPAGGSIYAKAGSNTAVTFTMFGREVQ